MAETARMADIRAALLRLADRFDEAARSREVEITRHASGK